MRTLVAALVAASLLAALPLQTRAGKPGPDETCIGVPSITTHEARMAIEAHRFLVQDCYRAALKRKPDLAGKMTVRYDLTYKSTEAVIEETSLEDPALLTCLDEAVGKVRFPPLRYESTQLVTIRFPYRLEPDNPQGQPSNVKIAYEDGERFEVIQDAKSITVRLPKGAREALATVRPDLRLVDSEDYKAKAKPPFPFAAVANFDKRHGDDLAIAMVHAEDPRLIFLVVLHAGPEGYQHQILIALHTTHNKVHKRFDDVGRMWVTRGSRCFCKHTCLGLATDQGWSLEYEWDGAKYTKTLEEYIRPAGR